MTSVVTPTAIPMASSLKNLAEITVDNDEAKILTILFPTRIVVKNSLGLSTIN